MVTIFAHFDGHVLVPESPVDLPRDRILEIHIAEPVVSPPAGSNFAFDMRNGVPVMRVPPGAPMVTSEEIRRALNEE